MVREADMDGSASLSFDEFKKAVLSARRTHEDPALAETIECVCQVENAFHIVDANGDPTCADEADDPAQTCKRFDGDRRTGQTSQDLEFFGRNFLFAPVYQPNPCDTKRTCETNSLGNPIG